ncbi:hypothetical protein [Cellulomonas sp. S1-8]|uniref:hypothetical protein n=1 Tax=Cellulomonas sp. S1-8 TaxID=2904790 RepID=UPI00224407C1|nr:hypothetical protein [Cellulomonas sp. S1-8]UZN02144.1 hypothetical protein OKX07_13745 [Cellulomonas sp. S1-8]
MAVFTRRNIGRTTRLWSWVALLGAPFFLVMGLLLVSGTGPGAQRPVEMWGAGAAGDAVELLPSGRTTAVWGRAEGDVTGVTCATSRSDGTPVADLVVGAPGDRPGTVEDVGGSGSWTWLATTEGTGAAATVTCSGGGLTEVAVSTDPSRAGTPSFGWVLVAVAPVVFVLGLVARRAGRSRALSS